MSPRRWVCDTCAPNRLETLHWIQRTCASSSRISLQFVAIQFPVSSDALLVNALVVSTPSIQGKCFDYVIMFG